MDSADVWPALPLAAWQDTCATLQLWSQVVGKVRLALSPPQNHWWHTALYLSARGLTTSPMPYGHEFLQIDFDFVDHRLVATTSTGGEWRLGLAPMSVSTFYRQVMDGLRDLEVEVAIWPIPREVLEPIPFDQDTLHAAYDPIYAQRFWRALLQTSRIFEVFRGHFLGKSSPVHFFWGSFDLAVTRFSSRRAPMFTGTAPRAAVRRGARERRPRRGAAHLLRVDVRRWRHAWQLGPRPVGGAPGVRMRPRAAQPTPGIIEWARL